MEHFTMSPSPEVQRYAERRKVARAAAAAITHGLNPPMSTPLEREAAREAQRIYYDRKIAAMRGRVQT